MNTDLKNLLTELVNAGYPTHRLGHFARIEIEATWSGLSAAEVVALNAWRENQQMATRGQAAVNWAYARAALTSVRQTHGAEAP